MRILFTGASSPIACLVLKNLLLDPSIKEIWCTQHAKKLPLESPKLRQLSLDLSQVFTLDPVPSPIDLVVHFAGLSHSFKDEDYWEVNYKGTIKLAQLARMKGCGRFVYISSWRANEGAGSYGESKLAAERALSELPWTSLLILRPSEVYGAGGKEGIDKWIRLAKDLHLVPMIFGNSNFCCRPLFVNDFVKHATNQITSHFQGVKKLNLAGPETLVGTQIAWRICRKYKALPLPVWWYLLSLGDKILKILRIHYLSIDQLLRSTSKRKDLLNEASIEDDSFLRFPEKI